MKFNAKAIESILGYIFDNKQLLQQAFTRSSYSEENGGLNNEVLEFLGDSVLNLAVTKFLIQFNGRNTNKGYESFLNEGELTKLKSHIVDTAYLSQRADQTKLSQYLIVGKSDKKITESMKEDLMEAIFGAVCYDSGFNYGEVFLVIERVLMLRDALKTRKADATNYVEELHLLLDEHGYDHPIYEYKQMKSGEKQIWHCSLILEELDMSSEGLGDTKKESRQKACKRIYNKVKNILYLDDADNDIVSLIGKQDKENCFQQLNQLVQHGIISKPRYDYKVDYDDNGNPYWYCECRVDEIKKYYFHSENYYSSKKTAQKIAAFALLEHICYGDDE